MARMTIVEPSLTTRIKIREMRPNDHEKASLTNSSPIRAPTTCTQAVTKGPNISVGTP